jgi:hypothetical protein
MRLLPKRVFDGGGSLYSCTTYGKSRCGESCHRIELCVHAGEEVARVLGYGERGIVALFWWKHGIEEAISHVALEEKTGGC